MMGLDSLGLGSAGSMSKTIMSIIGIGISAIILLTFAPKISGDVSGIALLGASDGYCQIQGEALDRVIIQDGAKNANDSWKTKTKAVILKKSTTSPIPTVAAGQCAAILTAATKYYTPQGEDVDIVTAVTAASGIPDSEWRPQSTALAAGGLGTLVQLLFGVMGLLIPAGALGYLGSVGADLVSNKLGGGIATSILVVVVGVVVVGAILPQIIDPLDTFFAAMDGNRYYIFSVGLGKIAGTISNFFGIALIAGVIGIGMMIWKGRGSGGSSDYA